MPRFVTIGYGDEAGYRRIPQTIVDAAHANDERLKQQGAITGITRTVVQVRNPEGTGVVTEDRPFLSSPLPVAACR
jgi:hypothetical protein